MNFFSVWRGNLVKVLKIKKQNVAGLWFAEMANDEDGQKAIDALNGTKHYERAIVVSQTKENQKTHKFYYNII